jgi:mannitol/fructose-specific phosphotransferase system IIA component (Ntr-type)
MQVVWGNKNSEKVVPMENGDIISYFDESLFIPNLQSTSKHAAFDELAGLFVQAKLVRKKDIVLEMLHKRETLGSTGIGKGVAIPHGRTTAAIDVKIAFGKSQKGMAFDAIDGKPVHLVFVVLAPPHDENNKYLPVLGKLVEIVSEKANRERLMHAETFQDLIQIIAGES